MYSWEKYTTFYSVILFFLLYLGQLSTATTLSIHLQKVSKTIFPFITEKGAKLSNTCSFYILSVVKSLYSQVVRKWKKTNKMAKQEQQKQSKRTVYSAATDENSVLERQSHCFLNRVRYKNHLLPQRTLENALLSYLFLTILFHRLFITKQVHILKAFLFFVCFCFWKTKPNQSLSSWGKKRVIQSEVFFKHSSI